MQVARRDQVAASGRFEHAHTSHPAAPAASVLPLPPHVTTNSWPLSQNEQAHGRGSYADNERKASAHHNEVWERVTATSKHHEVCLVESGALAAAHMHDWVRSIGVHVPVYV